MRYVGGSYHHQFLWLHVPPSGVKFSTGPRAYTGVTNLHICFSMKGLSFSSFISALQSAALNDCPEGSPRWSLAFCVCRSHDVVFLLGMAPGFDIPLCAICKRLCWLGRTPTVLVIISKYTLWSSFLLRLDSIGARSDFSVEISTYSRVFLSNALPPSIGPLRSFRNLSLLWAHLADSKWLEFIGAWSF